MIQTFCLITKCFFFALNIFLIAFRYVHIAFVTTYVCTNSHYTLPSHSSKNVDPHVAWGCRGLEGHGADEPTEVKEEQSRRVVQQQSICSALLVTELETALSYMPDDTE